MGTSEKFKPVTKANGIRQTGPKRWEVRIYLGRDPVTGKTRHLTRSTTAGIRAAKQLHAELTVEAAAIKAKAPAAGTFGELLDQWLTYGKVGRAATTLAGYRIQIESTIRPALGHLALDELTALDLDRFYARLTAEGVSPSTVHHHHRLIAAALRQGEKWGSVPTNVARNASPPRVPTKALNVPPPERVRALIDAGATSRTPEMATVITIAALTGCRRGELAGLQWGDIDWDGSALTVRHSVWQTSSDWGLKDPKTHQVRRLVLGDVAMAVLAGRRERARAAATAAAVTLADDAFVFSDEADSKRPIMPNTLTRRFGRLCADMEAPARVLAETEGRDLREEERWDYRLHDLRHYAATELFRAGHHARTVADRLGHFDPALTLRVYTHDTPAQALAAAEALEAGLQPE